ncbi:MAG TPA: hypothetical protein VN697_04095, partial [Tepidiformaceae bacterium]|nr:hypothetical protein [Tepidiformaceae bacterium]
MLDNNHQKPGDNETPGETPVTASRLGASRRTPFETLKAPKLLGLAAGIAAVAAIGGGFLATQGTASVASAASTPGAAGIVQTAASPADAAPGAAAEDFIAKLADRLGVDETTLKADLTQTSLDELSAQVSAGTITQAQADQITTSINNGDNYFFGIGGGPGGPG